jgi:hypothetical protein
MRPRNHTRRATLLEHLTFVSRGGYALPLSLGFSVCVSSLPLPPNGGFGSPISAEPNAGRSGVLPRHSQRNVFDSSSASSSAATSTHSV